MSAVYFHLISLGRRLRSRSLLSASFIYIPSCVFQYKITQSIRPYRQSLSRHIPSLCVYMWMPPPYICLLLWSLASSFAFESLDFVRSTPYNMKRCVCIMCVHCALSHMYREINRLMGELGGNLKWNHDRWSANASDDIRQNNDGTVRFVFWAMIRCGRYIRWVVAIMICSIIKGFRGCS